MCWCVRAYERVCVCVHSMFRLHNCTIKNKSVPIRVCLFLFLSVRIQSFARAYERETERKLCRAGGQVRRLTLVHTEVRVRA